MARLPIASLYVDEKDGEVVWIVEAGDTEQTVLTATAVELASVIDAAAGTTSARLAVANARRLALQARIEALNAEQTEVEATIVDLEMEGKPKGDDDEPPAPAPVPISKARRARASKASAAAPKASAEQADEHAEQTATAAPEAADPEPAPVTTGPNDDGRSDAAQDRVRGVPADVVGEDDIPPAEPPVEEDEF